MKKRLLLLLKLLALASSLLLSACGGSGGSVTSGGPAVSATDLDGDGLSNDVEALHGTSARLADTDGDGMSDEAEIMQLAFASDIDPLRFNPLVADVPRLGIVIRSVPSVRLLLTDALGEARAFETQRTLADREAIVQIETEIDVELAELAQSSTDSTTYVDGNPTGVTQSLDIGKTMTEGVTIIRTKEELRENLRALADIEAFEQSQNIVTSGGVLSFVVDLENRGSIPYRVDNLILAAVIPDPSRPGMFYPIGNLVMDTSRNYSRFSSFTMPPGGKLPAINFVNDQLDLETAKRLLRDARSLMVTVASMELLDIDGVPYAFRYLDIESRTAQVVIDFAGLRNTERYLVATNTDPDTPGITAGKALRNILRIPFEAGALEWGGQQKTGLLGLRNDPNVRADKQRNGYWQCVHTRGSGPNRKVTRYSVEQEDYDFEKIPLRAGDALYLSYMEDRDGDGIYSRQERLQGTSDLLADSDGDGWTDFHEIHVSRTRPDNPDTDGDGVIDSIDGAPLNQNAR